MYLILLEKILLKQQYTKIFIGIREKDISYDKNDKAKKIMLIKVLVKPLFFDKKYIDKDQKKIEIVLKPCMIGENKKALLIDGNRIRKKNIKANFLLIIFAKLKYKISDDINHINIFMR